MVHVPQVLTMRLLNPMVLPKISFVVVSSFCDLSQEKRRDVSEASVTAFQVAHFEVLCILAANPHLP